MWVRGSGLSSWLLQGFEGGLWPCWLVDAAGLSLGAAPGADEGKAVCTLLHQTVHNLKPSCLLAPCSSCDLLQARPSTRSRLSWHGHE